MKEALHRNGEGQEMKQISGSLHHEIERREIDKRLATDFRFRQRPEDWVKEGVQELFKTEY